MKRYRVFSERKSAMQSAPRRRRSASCSGNAFNADLSHFRCNSKLPSRGKWFRLNEIGFSGLTMAPGIADVVAYSKQTGFATSCTESAKDPFIYKCSATVALKAAACPPGFYRSRPPCPRQAISQPEIRYLASIGGSSKSRIFGLADPKQQGAEMIGISSL
jgi:hypothetical protein